MPKFKKDDIIRCIDQRNNSNITIDRPYKVIYVASGLVLITNNAGTHYYYSEKLFELVKWIPKVGEEIELQSHTDSVIWRAERYFIGYTKMDQFVYETDQGMIFAAPRYKMRQLKSTKTITIDGTDVEISNESFDKLKEFFQNL